jgi:GNAT superfamily N-acetyltransferase
MRAGLPELQTKAQAREAHIRDLPQINQVISAAVMTWDLPERVKRLALSSYHYHTVDFAHFGMRVIEQAGALVGVAAWEPADPRDLPEDAPAQAKGLLLHGIYVDPAAHRQGHGRMLVEHALEAAAAEAMVGVLVKAQSDAVPFFQALGWQRLPVRDRVRDYEHRYWQAL